jgi:hypothetical protein
VAFKLGHGEILDNFRDRSFMTLYVAFYLLVDVQDGEKGTKYYRQHVN